MDTGRLKKRFAVERRILVLSRGREKKKETPMGAYLVNNKKIATWLTSMITKISRMRRIFFSFLQG